MTTQPVQNAIALLQPNEKAFFHARLNQSVFLRGEALRDQINRKQAFWGILMQMPDTEGNVKIRIDGAQTTIDVPKEDVVGDGGGPAISPEFERYLSSRVGKDVCLLDDGIVIANATGSLSRATLISFDKDDQYAWVQLNPADSRYRSDAILPQYKALKIMLSLSNIYNLHVMETIEIVDTAPTTEGSYITYDTIEQRVCRMACEAMHGLTQTTLASDYPGKAALQAGFCPSCAPDGTLPDESTWRNAMNKALDIVLDTRADSHVRYVRFACPNQMTLENRPLMLSDTQCHPFILLIQTDDTKNSNTYFIMSEGLSLFLKGALLQQLSDKSLWTNEGVYASVNWGNIKGWSRALASVTNLHFVCKAIDETSVRRLLSAAFSRGYVLSTRNIHIEADTLRHSSEY